MKPGSLARKRQGAKSCGKSRKMRRVPLLCAARQWRVDFYSVFRLRPSASGRVPVPALQASNGIIMEGHTG